MRFGSQGNFFLLHNYSWSPGKIGRKSERSLHIHIYRYIHGQSGQERISQSLRWEQRRLNAGHTNKILAIKAKRKMADVCNIKFHRNISWNKQTLQVKKVSLVTRRLNALKFPGLQLKPPCQQRQCKHWIHYWIRISKHMGNIEEAIKKGRVGQNVRLQQQQPKCKSWTHAGEKSNDTENIAGSSFLGDNNSYLRQVSLTEMNEEGAVTLTESKFESLLVEGFISHNHQFQRKTLKKWTNQKK